MLNPTITMRSGDVHRLRMLNAAQGKFMSPTIDDHEMHVLAWDGLTLVAPDATDVVMLSASNRVDVLVPAGEPGTSEMVVTPGSSQEPNIPGMPGGRFTRAHRAVVDGLHVVRHRREPYSPAREPYQPQLGTAEELTVVNDLDDQLMNHAHVFHIHVNPFKVTKINGEDQRRDAGHAAVA